jgi:hypothetical protein
MNALEKLSRKLEHFETDPWAARRIFDVEKFPKQIIDAGCGTGILTKAAEDRGHEVQGFDVHDWGGYVGKYPRIFGDYLEKKRLLMFEDFAVFTNPPFSKACEFVQKSFELGAWKVVCFQRFAWWESEERREFWDKFSPNRIHVCANRATCWRHDLPKDAKGNRLDPKTGKKLAGTTTAHAWFVFEKGYSGAPKLHRLYKNDLTKKD